ncbi:MAG: DNA alkylation repair protein [Eubacteriales bacterium]|nr:DNA alkylation repair protein [Eubacteriales bacterium]
MNFKQVCTEMIRHSDPKKGRGIARFLKGRYEFMGVESKLRRKIANQYLKQDNCPEEIDWEYVDACWDQVFREFQYLALDYLQQRAELLQISDLYKLRRLIQEKPGWDICDQMGRLALNITSREPEGKKQILEWSRYNDSSVRRVAIIHQLDLRGEADEELLTEIIEGNLPTKEPIIKKAITRALSEYSKYKPEFVEDFIWQNSEKMSAEMRREAGKNLPPKE